MLEIACMLDITSSGELQNLLFERRYFFLQQLVIFHQGEVLSAIATNYRLLFEFFGTIRTFHLRLPAYFLLVACYIRKYEYCHRRAMIACTITHITAETGRYGGGRALRFCTENEEAPGSFHASEFPRITYTGSPASEKNPSRNCPKSDSSNAPTVDLAAIRRPNGPKGSAFHMPARLRCRHLRAFSDGFSRHFGE